MLLNFLKHLFSNKLILSLLLNDPTCVDKYIVEYSMIYNNNDVNIDSTLFSEFDNISFVDSYDNSRLIIYNLNLKFKNHIFNELNVFHDSTENLKFIRQKDRRTYYLMHSVYRIESEEFELIFKLNKSDKSIDLEIVKNKEVKKSIVISVLNGSINNELCGELSINHKSELIKNDSIKSLTSKRYNYVSDMETNFYPIIVINSNTNDDVICYLDPKYFEKEIKIIKANKNIKLKMKGSFYGETIFEVTEIKFYNID